MKTVPTLPDARAVAGAIAIEVGATITVYEKGDTLPSYMQPPAPKPPPDDTGVTDAAGAAKLSPALWATIKAYIGRA